MKFGDFSKNLSGLNILDFLQTSNLFLKNQCFFITKCCLLCICYAGTIFDSMALKEIAHLQKKQLLQTYVVTSEEYDLFMKST